MKSTTQITRLSLIPILACFLMSTAAPMHNLQGQEEAEPSDESRTSAEIVGLLVGTWDFAVTAPEDRGGEVQSSGRRTTEAISDLSVSWSETYEGEDRVGRGLTGFDGDRAEFYSMSVHSNRVSPSYMTGRMDDSGMVLFEPLFLMTGERPFQVVMEVTGDDEIVYYPRRRGPDGEWEIGWRAVFTRVTEDSGVQDQ